MQRTRFRRKDGLELQQSQKDESFDCSFSSEETTYGQVEGINENQDCVLSKNQHKGLQNQLLVSFQLKKIHDLQTLSNYNNSTLNQTIKHRFSSISRLYSEFMVQNMMMKNQKSMYKNIQIKNYQRNIQTRHWKISLLQIIANKDKQGKQKFDKIKKTIFKQKVNVVTVEPQQIQISKCQCGLIVLQNKGLNTHIKKTSHKIILNIDTKRQRKYQSKVYDEFGCQFKIQKFDMHWLFKSFQVLFLQAGIHSIQAHQIKNNQIILQLLKLQDCDQLADCFSEIQVQRWFIKRWMKIYMTLHSVHKGNQRLCHKCLTIQEHICLFALGFNQLINRNRRTIFFQVSQKLFISILKSLKSLLQDFVQKPKYNKMSLQPQNLKICKKVQKLLYYLLIRYFESFDYIDASQFGTNYTSSNDNLY